MRRADGIRAARRATIEWPDDVTFERDVFGDLSLVQNGVLVRNTFRKRRDAATLDIAREIGWSLERLARSIFWGGLTDEQRRELHGYGRVTR